MARLNKVFLVGNLTRDPELRYTPAGTAVASFRLAVSDRYKQGDDWKDRVCYVDVTVWDKQAERCSEYLTKGSGVLIEGRLNFQSWETEAGQKRSKLDVVAQNVQFLPRAPKAAEAEAEDTDSSDDDIPF